MNESRPLTRPESERLRPGKSGTYPKALCLCNEGHICTNYTHSFVLLCANCQGKYASHYAPPALAYRPK